MTNMYTSEPKCVIINPNIKANLFLKINATILMLVHTLCLHITTTKLHVKEIKGYNHI